MSTNRNELKKAVHSIMNDVVEQCFHHLAHHPHLSEPLNRIIKDASDEINYQVIKIDAHDYSRGSSELEEHYRRISRDLHRKSLELLSELQKIQKGEFR